jgi:UPF0716 protein FxsA
MNVAKWLLIALLALPVAELAVLIAVVVTLGLAWAVMLQAASSLTGLVVLRHAGGTHVSRVRSALGQGRITALTADGTGSLTLLAGILLLIPGFITDVAGLLVLIGTALRRTPPRPAGDGVIDLPPEQWRRVDDPALGDHRDDRQR